ncbi:MAG: WXG100 family type VII secretion target [Mobilicoccus sp.]|nr:WXG100 family type VII secretion target [Mobilicoccus sp.]
MIVSYDSAVAREAESSLKATANHLQNTLAELSSYVGQVCSGWEGDEQVVYRDIQNRWDRAANEIHQILNRITVSLGNNTTSVESMRAQVRSALQK